MLAISCRFAGNAMLARHEAAYEAAKAAGEKPPSVSSFSPDREFTRLRHTTPWLFEYAFPVTRYALKNQADASRAFFRGEARHPRFKSRNGSVPSFMILEAITIRNGVIGIRHPGDGSAWAPGYSAGCWP